MKLEIPWTCTDQSKGNVKYKISPNSSCYVCSFLRSVAKNHFTSTIVAISNYNVATGKEEARSNKFLVDFPIVTRPLSSSGARRSLYFFIKSI